MEPENTLKSQTTFLTELALYDLALKIHISESAGGALKEFPEFITELRGEVFIKVNYSQHYNTTVISNFSKIM